MTDPPWLLGGSGQVGFFLQQHLGDACVPCARSVPTWAAGTAARWRLFDLWASREAPACERLISAGPLDAAVGWLERAGPGALRRIVALGSMSAVHKETSPSRAERELAQRLQASERRLFAFAAAHGIGCTLLRPTLIWGAGLDRSLTPFAQAAARRGYALIPSGATGMRQPVHAEDLALLCIALLADDHAAAMTFEVAGGERLPLRDVLARTAHSVGARAIRWPVPGFALSALAQVAMTFGINAAALSRAMQDQCARDDVVWHRCHRVPRAFHPVAGSWVAPS